MEANFGEFIRIAKHINEVHAIIPVLFGSLGLQIITGHDFNPRDIDILIPRKYIFDEWKSFQKSIEALGYTFVDLEEHEFKKDGLKISFSYEEDLDTFADVSHRTLEIHTYNHASYKLLSIYDYLKVYSKSLQDGYRREKNNAKDEDKIRTLTGLLETYKCSLIRK